MDILIWVGVAVSLIGLLGLVYCILFVAKAKRRALNDDDMKAVLQKALPLNLGSLFLSVIGLMLVILGIFFG
mgnify:CR=1 FL=1